jgi:predicted Zn-dependent peptidase
MCDRLHPDYYAADVTTDLLATGSSSRLYQRLVKNEKAFVEIDAHITASDDIGMIVIEGKVSDGYDVHKAYDLLWRELDAIKKEKAGDAEVRKCKNKILTYMNFSESSLLNRAISLAYYEKLGNANRINEEEDNYERVSSESIHAFVNKTFLKEKSNTLFYLRK